METLSSISCSDQDFLMEESYDAQSTTSDIDYEQCSNQEEFEEPICKSYVDYLQQASDDELGLPPCSNWFGDEVLVIRPFDLDFDVEESGTKLDQKMDDSLFWLSLLRS
ncbi:hypothetical protein SUGI_0937350 [Cryptomeria japonica]|nr:hypothetical protein SUGI_0937350 [Cryptomeria japonica]